MGCCNGRAGWARCFGWGFWGVVKGTGSFRSAVVLILSNVSNHSSFDLSSVWNDQCIISAIACFFARAPTELPHIISSPPYVCSVDVRVCFLNIVSSSNLVLVFAAVCAVCYFSKPLYFTSIRRIVAVNSNQNKTTRSGLSHQDKPPPSRRSFWPKRPPDDVPGRSRWPEPFPGDLPGRPFAPRLSRAIFLTRATSW